MKPRPGNRKADREATEDLQQLALWAAQATNLTIDRVLASLGSPTNHRMPPEPFAAENLLRERLARLPAEAKAELSRTAVERLRATGSKRKQFYGDFGGLSVADTSEATATLTRRALPGRLKDLRVRLHSKLAERSAAGYLPGSLGPALHLVKDKLDEQLRGRGTGDRRAGRPPEAAGPAAPRSAGPGKPPRRKLQPAPARVKELGGSSRAKAAFPHLEPALKLKVPSAVELRLKKVTCNTKTAGLGKDDIYVAARLCDYYGDQDSLTAPFKVGEFNDRNRVTVFSPPRSLGTIPVADNLVFDSIFDATIYLAESDLGPRDFEKYVEANASVSGRAMRELVVSTYLSIAILFMIQEDGSLEDLAKTEPALLLVGKPGALAAAALGLLPPKWQFLVVGLLGAIPAVIAVVMFSFVDGFRRLIKDEIFPENLVHLHLEGPILLSASQAGRSFPARLPDFELRKQRHTRAKVVVADRDTSQLTTEELCEQQEPDLIASYTLDLEWVVHTSEENLPIDDLEPAQPLTDETEALRRLDQEINHIIVIMLENRSFDHMLGFLEHDRKREGLDPTVSEELPDGRPRKNQIADFSFEPFPLKDSRFPFDPRHNVEQVGLQIWGPNSAVRVLAEAGQDLKTDAQIEFPADDPTEPMSGFVQSYRRVVDGERSSVDPGNAVNLERPEEADFQKNLGKNLEDVRQIMGYQPAEHVPYFDFLATEFGVCSKWFSAFPGNTWVNRTLAYTGKPAKFRREGQPTDERLVVDNAFPIDEPSFVRILEAKGRNWAWYAQDIPSLLVVDLSMADEIVTKRIRPIEKFFEDLKDPAGFPEVAWIDPNFMDVGDLGSDARAVLRRLRELARPGQSPGIGEEVVDLNTANSDQPPSDVMHGQAFIQMIIEKLMESPVWNKSLVIVTYDEHGGFYDHVPPEKLDPALQPDLGPLNPFQWRGPRVPALVVSPHIGRQLVFSQAPPDGRGVQKVVDHLSIQRTIFERFCKNPDGTVDFPSKRVEAAEHLGWVLSGPNLRFPPDTASRSSALGRRRRVFKKAMHAVAQARVAADQLRNKARRNAQMSEFQRVYAEKQRLVIQRLGKRILPRRP